MASTNKKNEDIQVVKKEKNGTNDKDVVSAYGYWTTAAAVVYPVLTIEMFPNGGNKKRIDTHTQKEKPYTITYESHLQNKEGVKDFPRYLKSFSCKRTTDSIANTYSFTVVSDKSFDLEYFLITGHNHVRLRYGVCRQDKNYGKWHDVMVTKWDVNITPYGSSISVEGVDEGLGQCDTTVPAKQGVFSVDIKDCKDDDNEVLKKILNDLIKSTSDSTSAHWKLGFIDKQIGYPVEEGKDTVEINVKQNDKVSDVIKKEIIPKVGLVKDADGKRKVSGETTSGIPIRHWSTVRSEPIGSDTSEYPAFEINMARVEQTVETDGGGDGYNVLFRVNIGNKKNDPEGGYDQDTRTYINYKVDDFSVTQDSHDFVGINGIGGIYKEFVKRQDSSMFGGSYETKIVYSMLEDKNSVPENKTDGMHEKDYEYTDSKTYAASVISSGNSVTGDFNRDNILISSQNEGGKKIVHALNYVINATNERDAKLMVNMLLALKRERAFSVNLTSFNTSGIKPLDMVKIQAYGKGNMVHPASGNYKVLSVEETISDGFFKARYELYSVPSMTDSRVYDEYEKRMLRIAEGNLGEGGVDGSISNRTWNDSTIRKR